MAVLTIDKNGLSGTEHNPPNNELVERVFRLAAEKILHCKSMKSFEKNVITYFNDNDLRLNG